MSQSIFSADSHFVEPPEIWAERVDAEFRDRAPRIAHELDGQPGAFLVCEGLAPASGSGYFAAGTSPEDLPEVLARGYDAVPDHVRDPGARLVAQEKDGVVGEVLYASYGMQLFHLEDLALRAALFRAFNDWASDYCNADPTRLVGVGLIDLDDVAAAVTELHRIADRGLKGAMIWAEPPADRPYSSPEYEPFWAAAQDLDMKLSLHSLTSKRPDSDPGKGDMLYRSVLLYMEVARTLSDFILHGVFEKFPGLTVISAENEITWLPFHLWRMDQLFDKLYKMSPVQLSMKPSDYFHRQCYATFIEDAMFTNTMDHLHASNIMFSSDFPHLASTWPESQKFVADFLGGLSEADRRAIVCDNVKRLYRVP